MRLLRPPQQGSNRSRQHNGLCCHASRSAELGLYDPVVQLFDTLVLPVMLYAVELWGTQYTQAKHPGLDVCETANAFSSPGAWCARSAPKIVMLAETGRFPLVGLQSCWRTTRSGWLRWRRPVHRIVPSSAAQLGQEQPTP